MRKISLPYRIIRESNASFKQNHTEDCYNYTAITPDLTILSIPENLKSKVKLVAEINCSSTMYRTCIQSNEVEKIEISIPKDEVKIRFTIDLMYISNDNIDYLEQRFNKGQVLAFLGRKSVNIDARRQSLISFDKLESGNEIEYSFTNHCIKVRMPKKQFNQILKKQHAPLFKSVFSSPLAQLALLQGCRHLEAGSSKNHLLWFKELENLWKKLRNPADNEKDYPDVDDYLPFVNKILKNPSIRLIDDLIKSEQRENNE